MISKLNGGHGSAINVGLAQARREYLKVMDADDWLDPDALGSVVATLGGFLDAGRPVDLLVSNFVYENAHIPEERAAAVRENGEAAGTRAR